MSCSICFDEIPQHDKFTSQCNHEFHNSCLIHWITTKHTCPVCRTEFYDEEKASPVDNTEAPELNYGFIRRGQHGYAMEHIRIMDIILDLAVDSKFEEKQWRKGCDGDNKFIGFLSLLQLTKGYKQMIWGRIIKTRLYNNENSIVININTSYTYKKPYVTEKIKKQNLNRVMKSKNKNTYSKHTQNYYRKRNFVGKRYVKC